MKFESKFNLGQEVYYLDEESYPLGVKFGVIESILVEPNKDGDFDYKYNMGGIDFIDEALICYAESREKAERIFGLR